MAEPLSIVTGCVGLLSGIINVTKGLGAFVSEVKGARGDINAVLTELESLRLCVEGLKTDTDDAKLEYPEEMAQSLSGILSNANGVVEEMKSLLLKLESLRLHRRLQWAVNGKSDMNNLRSRLEAHKTALNLGMTMSAQYVHLLCLDNPTTDTPELAFDQGYCRYQHYPR